MPSWKKVITSGSAAALSSLNVTGAITGSSVLISGSTGTLFSSNVDTLVLTGSLLVTGSTVLSGSLNVSQGITGSLFGTSSWAVSASLASTASLANLINTTPTLTSGIYPMVFVSSSANGILYKYQNSSFSYNPGTDTLTLSYITSSLFGTASYARQTLSASFASTASYVNTLNQSVIITGSAVIGSSSLGASENTLTLGARDTTNEGGQIGFNAPGGTYTSASFIDNWQNKHRILKGNNTTSTGLIAQWDIHTTQMQLPGYTGASSFTGTATANLAVDSGGNVITVSTSGGSVFPYTGTAGVTGSISATGPIYSQVNGGMYFQGGDDAALYDINISNHMGIYGVQDSTVGTIKLGSGGGTVSGQGGNIGINTTNPTSASLTVNGNVWATSFTGSLFGTASWAVSASWAPTPALATTASYALTSSNVQGGTANYIPIWNTATSLSSSAIYQSTGNVGIGTTSPSQKLSVSGNISLDTGGFIYGDTTTPYLRLSQTNGSFLVYGGAGIGLYGALADIYASNRITFDTNGSEKMRIDASGNVGIGTTTPNAKLDVNGNAIVTGSLQISSSIFQYSNNAAITSGSTANIASFPTSSYMAGFFDFVASSGLNARAGTVFTVWNGASLEFTETSTNDIGTTTNLILSASLSGANVLLQGTSLSGSWNVKTLTRMI